MAAPRPRSNLFGPLPIAAAAIAGWLISTIVQNWGIGQLGWFSEPCDDMRGVLALCLAPGPKLGWQIVGMVAGVAVWLGLRIGVPRLFRRW